MPQLHQRGVDLLLNLMDTEEHFDNVTRDELRRLISEAVVVFGQLLERENPDEAAESSYAARPVRRQLIVKRENGGPPGVGIGSGSTTAARTAR